MLIGIRNSNRRGGAFFRSRSQLVSAIYHLPSTILIVRGFSGIWPGTRRLPPVDCRLLPGACRLEKANGGLHSVCPGGAICGTKCNRPAHTCSEWAREEKNGGQIERRASSEQRAPRTAWIGFTNYEWEWERLILMRDPLLARTYAFKEVQAGTAEIPTQNLYVFKIF